MTRSNYPDKRRNHTQDGTLRPSWNSATTCCNKRNLHTHPTPSSALGWSISTQSSRMFSGLAVWLPPSNSLRPEPAVEAAELMPHAFTPVSCLLKSASPETSGKG